MSDLKSALRPLRLGGAFGLCPRSVNDVETGSSGA